LSTLVACIHKYTSQKGLSQSSTRPTIVQRIGKGACPRQSISARHRTFRNTIYIPDVVAFRRQPSHLTFSGPAQRRKRTWSFNLVSCDALCPLRVADTWISSLWEAACFVPDLLPVPCAQQLMPGERLNVSMMPTHQRRHQFKLHPRLALYPSHRWANCKLRTIALCAARVATSPCGLGTCVE